VSEIIGVRWKVTEVLAVGWDDGMAVRFPNADHANCLQQMRQGEHGWEPFDPVRCHGWHCNRCGRPTNSYGHHHCPDRPER
jgi:hypothetical protein